MVRIMRKPQRLANPSSTFLVGKNGRGQWVVQDQRGLCGAMFVRRAEAIRFAMYASGEHPRKITMVPGRLELNMRRVDEKPVKGG
jgi:hypothetical protein